MTTKPKTRKAPAAEVAAPSRDSKEDYATIEKWQPAEDENALMVKAAETGNDAVADLRHSEELNRMKLRVLGLETTIIAADEGFWDGVQQLVSDISQQMENCSGAFEYVRQLRRAKCDKDSQEAT
jgi:hypothetical protein